MRLEKISGRPGCWPLRAIRGARPDRNPLRRGIDRLETCLLVGLFVALAAVTPFAARLAGHASYLSALHARQEQLVARHQVRAVLTEDAGPGQRVLAQRVRADPGHLDLRRRRAPFR